MPDDDPAADVIDDVLRQGEISITGRLSDASNLTLLGMATLDGVAVECIYKPVRGERPLWDFPDGTLAERELAAFLVSAAAGWDCVPLTIIRDGPYGPGMVQRWISDCDPDLMVDLVPVKKVPKGWLPVMRAVDVTGHDVAVVHADNPALAVLAAFDVAVNNADRKGGHVLAMPDGHRYGVDHGVTFHVEHKLRTVLWGWAGEPLTEEELAGVEKVLDALRGDLGERLEDMLAVTEVEATRRRAQRLLRTGVLPDPEGSWPVIPWPPF